MDTVIPPAQQAKDARTMPAWQRASLRKLAWQALGICLAVSAVSIAFLLLSRLIIPAWAANPGFVFAMLLLFVPHAIVHLAYRRGLADGRTHPSDAEATGERDNV